MRLRNNIIINFFVLEKKIFFSQFALQLRATGVAMMMISQVV
jgi:hypothetical protein